MLGRSKVRGTKPRFPVRSLLCPTAQASFGCRALGRPGARRDPKRVVLPVSPAGAPSTLGNREQLREGRASRVDRAAGRTGKSRGSRGHGWSPMRTYRAVAVDGSSTRRPRGRGRGSRRVARVGLRAAGEASRGAVCLPRGAGGRRRSVGHSDRVQTCPPSPWSPQPQLCPSPSETLEAAPLCRRAFARAAPDPAGLGRAAVSITMPWTASLDGAGPAGLGCPACLWPCWGAGGARLGRLVCRAPACRPLGAPPHATRGPCVRRSRGRVGVGHLPRASRPGAGGKDAQVQVPHYGGCSDRRERESETACWPDRRRDLAGTALWPGICPRRKLLPAARSPWRGASAVPCQPGGGEGVTSSSPDGSLSGEGFSCSADRCPWQVRRGRGAFPWRNVSVRSPAPGMLDARGRCR